jgi:hypothetical protein
VYNSKEPQIRFTYSVSSGIRSRCQTGPTTSSRSTIRTPGRRHSRRVRIRTDHELSLIVRHRPLHLQLPCFRCRPPHVWLSPLRAGCILVIAIDIRRQTERWRATQCRGRADRFGGTRCSWAFGDGRGVGEDRCGDDGGAVLF